MLTIAKNHLRAALQCADTKDVRYYLVGVHIERTGRGDVHIVSTDGNCLFAGLIAQALSPQAGPWRLTIPLDVVKRESKGKGDVLLTAVSDGKYLLGSSVFAPVDGQFPDWRRVSPSRAVIETRGEQPAQFDADLLARCADALREWHDGGRNFSPYLHQCGHQTAVMTGDNMTGYCVVMPLRRCNGEGVYPFTPSTYEARS